MGDEKERVKWSREQDVGRDFTCLVDYFFMDAFSCTSFERDVRSGRSIKGPYGYASKECIQAHLERLKECKLGGFEEVVARLAAASNQDIWAANDGDKVAFEAIGTFKNQSFSLYNYKGDEQIHIGASSKFATERNQNVVDSWLDELKSDLAKQLSSATPQPFDHTCKYSGVNFKYPPIPATAPALPPPNRSPTVPARQPAQQPRRSARLAAAKNK